MTQDPRGAALGGADVAVVPGGGTGYPFVGIPSFLHAPICTDLKKLDADIAVLGAPTDEGSPYLPGSRFGPRSIREHSLRFFDDGYYDPEAKREFLQYELTHHRIADVGDAGVLPTNAELTFQNITELTAAVLERGALPIVLGGDHAISYPVARAFKEPFHVVHFDAHIDYLPFMHGFRFTNAHAFRQIRHLSTVQTMSQVGIRSLRHRKSWVDDSVNDGNRVVTMEEFHDLKPSGIVEALPRDARCYVSIDIDVLDLPLVPGCVSAEPNGMSYKELRDTLFALAEHTEIIGFDLVEVNPQLDVGTGITSYMAAHTVLEFLSRICDQPRWAKRPDKSGKSATTDGP
ncbi:MAG: arginase family protein [Dehalococcoidia bacterium]